MARPARSLDVLLAEVNALAPSRSKTSDGWIGDPAHASRPSRHNPNNAGVVCARDITHDPKGGCDIHAIARRLVQNPPEVLEYVISNGAVAKRSNGWKWQRYSGANPHDKHAHFAVGRGPDSEPTPPYDDTTPWGIAPQQEDDMSTQAEAAIARMDPVIGKMAQDVISIRAETDKLWSGETVSRIAAASAAATIAALPAGNSGKPIDVDALAKAIAGNLAERLKD